MQPTTLANSIFSTLVREDEGFALKNGFIDIPIYDESESGMTLEMIDPSGLCTFRTPSQVYVSRKFPGYDVLSLAGADQDEALARLLSSSGVTQKDIATLRMMMATPGVANRLVSELWSRPGMMLKGREYQNSSEVVLERSNEIVRAIVKEASDASVLAYTSLILNVFVSCGLVSPPQVRHVASIPRSYVLSADDIASAVLAESMKTCLTASVTPAVQKSIGDKYTVQVLGEALGRELRRVADYLQIVEQRAYELEIVKELVVIKLVAPNRLPVSFRNYPALVELADIANFVLLAAETPLKSVNTKPTELSEMRLACDNVLQALRSLTAAAPISIDVFRSQFGTVPTWAPHGVRKGLVIYTASEQQSVMHVVSVAESGPTTQLKRVVSDYLRAPAIAATLSQTFLSLQSVTALANIVADELSRLDWSDEFTVPMLRGIGVSQSDLTILAMAMADTVSFSHDPTIFDDELHTMAALPPRLVYSVSVKPDWRTQVMAASPDYAFFENAAAVVVYLSEDEAVLPAPIPARLQSLPVETGVDQYYIGHVTKYLSKKVNREYRCKIPIMDQNGQATTLEFVINPLAPLTVIQAPDGKGELSLNPDYRTILEPGVDSAVSARVKLAVAYANSPFRVEADKAVSWIISNIVPFMVHPVIGTYAQRALADAYRKAKLDGRRLGLQIREITIQAQAATAFGLLQRFGKLNDFSNLEDILQIMPSSMLQQRAALSLASVPDVNGALSVHNNLV